MYLYCLQAWPFAFQHGGSIDCAVSPRWSPNPEATSPNQNTNTSRSSVLHRESTQNCLNTLDNYNQDYIENGYSEREYEDIGNDVSNCNNNVQYCNYSYKDNLNYYGVRNNYSSDSVMNNV